MAAEDTTTSLPTATEIHAMAAERLAQIEPQADALDAECNTLRAMLGMEARNRVTRERVTPTPSSMDGDGDSASRDGTGENTSASANGNGNSTPRRGRPAGTGQRAQQALSLLRDNGPMTIRDLADKMGIKQNYLYRVMPSLGKEKKVTKLDDGRYAIAA